MHYDRITFDAIIFILKKRTLNNRCIMQGQGRKQP